VLGGEPLAELAELLVRVCHGRTVAGGVRPANRRKAHLWTTRATVDNNLINELIW
jgi:hypothetical protein